MITQLWDNEKNSRYSPWAYGNAWNVHRKWTYLITMKSAVSCMPSEHRLEGEARNTWTRQRWTCRRWWEKRFFNMASSFSHLFLASPNLLTHILVLCVLKYTYLEIYLFSFWELCLLFSPFQPCIWILWRLLLAPLSTFLSGGGWWWAQCPCSICFMIGSWNC